MMKEPKAVKEIHDIRSQMYDEFKNLSLEERMVRIKEGAEIERRRIYGVRDESH